MGVTINDVARHAGVSKKTVSRVLNQEPNVSQKTKQRVTQAFTELGYRPSPIARGLARNQSFLIGLLYDNPNKSYVTDVQNGSLRVCNQKGYHLVIHPADHRDAGVLDEIQGFILTSHLDGLVLTPPFSDMPELLERLEKMNVPAVRIGATFEQSPFLAITSNDVEASFQMTKFLCELGHERIAFIKGHPDHSVSELRYQGYVNALKSHSLDLDESLIKEGDFSFESGEKLGKELLSNKPLPTAIYASNDDMAAGVLKVAKQMAIDVPEMVSVTGFDDAAIAGHLWPSLTTIRQPIEQMAERALEMLLKKIQGDELDDEQVAFVDELVIRASSDKPLADNP